MQKITTFLTFESRGKEAMEFYAGIFKNSKVNAQMTSPEAQLLYGDFTLDGVNFYAMDGGPTFKFEPGTSLFVTCEDQAEVDYFWEKLSEGGQPGQCGWLKDQFGVSWQIIPTALGRLMNDPDQAAAMRVRDAMLKMGKIEISELEKAHG